MALISALGALLLLTPLVLALLSMSTFELLISRNLVEATQALFAAEDLARLLRLPRETVTRLLRRPSPRSHETRIAETTGVAPRPYDTRRRKRARARLPPS